MTTTKCPPFKCSCTEKITKQNGKCLGTQDDIDATSCPSFFESRNSGHLWQWAKGWMYVEVGTRNWTIELPGIIAPHVPGAVRHLLLCTFCARYARIYFSLLSFFILFFCYTFAVRLWIGVLYPFFGSTRPKVAYFLSSLIGFTYSVLFRAQSLFTKLIFIRFRIPVVFVLFDWIRNPFILKTAIWAATLWNMNASQPNRTGVPTANCIYQFEKEWGRLSRAGMYITYYIDIGGGWELGEMTRNLRKRKR